ncbi:hypothetical protein BV20DRAFT_453271 [Pilatotrama ljubarskyi]|nr:hypothetical protein BV20DRAFT_453271 [Pilatotrama ljubarskyi]
MDCSQATALEIEGRRASAPARAIKSCSLGGIVKRLLRSPAPSPVPFRAARGEPRSCPFAMAIAVNPYAFFDVTIGMTLIGLAVTASLFGVSTAQMVWYYKHYPRDRRFLKMLVALVWTFDAFHLVLYLATMWIYLVLKQVEALGPTLLPWESNVQLLCNACAIVTIQAFYAYRIWTLSQSRYLAALLVTFVLGDFGLAFALFIKSIMTDNVQDYIGLSHLDIALSSITAFTDVLLSGTLVVLLAMSRTGSAGANRLINKLVLYTINTGLLTSFCAVLSLIAVAILPTTSIYVMFYYIGARLYSVSLLATLNARESLRIQAERIGHVSLPRLTSISNVSSKQRVWDGAQSRPPDIVLAIQHSSSVAFEDDDDEGIKEVYRRPRSHHEHLEEVDEGASSLRDWEPVKTSLSGPPEH